MEYKALIYDHLSKYRIEVIGLDTDECGVWKGDGKPRPWILPEEKKWLNLICSDANHGLKQWTEDHPEVSLHPDFHHLNSSQAMCWNLFFPMLDNPRYHPLLTNLLGLPPGDTIAEWDFEKVFLQRKDDPVNEGTNFDLWILMASGRHLFFESKLSEVKFSTQEDKPSVETKRKGIYKKRLSGYIPTQFLEAPLFHQNYQIIRNLSYLPLYPESLVFFVYPKANELLEAKQSVIDEICSDVLTGRADTLYLEDIVHTIIRLAELEPTLLKHYGLFAEKYLVSPTNRAF